MIAHFNGSATIARAIHSVKTQTFASIELIIVDDGSLPRELQFLKELKPTFDFTLIEQKNMGQSAARNQGVKLSRGQAICFLDQDDWYLPGHVEDLWSAWVLEDRQHAVVFGDSWRSNQKGQIIQRGTLRSDLNFDSCHIFDLVAKDLMITPSQILVSREEFLAVSGFDSALQGYEDDDLLIRLFLAGKSFLRINNPVLVWTINKSSTTYSEAMSDSSLKFFEKIANLFFDNSFSPGQSFPVSHLLLPRFLPKFASDLLSASSKELLVFERAVSRFRTMITIASAEKGFKQSLTFVRRAAVMFALRTPIRLLKISIALLTLIPIRLRRFIFSFYQ